MTTKLGLSASGTSGVAAAAFVALRWATTVIRQSRAKAPSAIVARRIPCACLLCCVCRMLITAGSPTYRSKQLPALKLRNARDRSGRAELFDGVAERFDRGAGRFAAFEFLVVAVDPDHRHLHFQQRGDVVVVVAADVGPAFLAADSPGRLFEMDGVRLV